MKKTFYSIAALAVFIAGCQAPPSASSLELQLYEDFPPGMSFEEASGKAQRKYNGVRLFNENGYFKQQAGEAGALVGTKSIAFTAHRQRSGMFTIHDYQANLAFDDSGGLIDIWVRQTVDAP